MDKKTEIKKRLSYGSIDEYVVNYYSKNYDKVEEYLNKINSLDGAENYDIMPPYIREEWDDEDVAISFLNDGYTRDDIIYEDWDDASQQSMSAYIEDITSDIVQLHFNGDQDYYNSVFKYLKSQKV